MRLFMAIVLALLAVLAGIAGVGFWREAQAARTQLAALQEQGVRAALPPITEADFKGLPAPVARYLRQALGDTPRPIRSVRLQQRGELRIGPQARSWNDFSAEQQVWPGAPGFVWQARVALPLGTHLRVLDAYAKGQGRGRVSVLSAWAVADEANRPELNAGALHRYLAEAVWYPSALLPAAGVRWAAVSDTAARATLADGGQEVELEFRFNADGEVTGIHTPARWGRFDGRYRQAAWEGRFSDYRRIDGLWVPGRGEVGWHEAGRWQVVWRGALTGLEIDWGAPR